jgi:hypothetical protein
MVEIFLRVYQDGRFAHHVDWLPQPRANVEVIASAEDGSRLAIEHTRLLEFPVGRRLNNPDRFCLLGCVVGHDLAVNRSQAATIQYNCVCRPHTLAGP